MPNIFEVTSIHNREVICPHCGNELLPLFPIKPDERKVFDCPRCGLAFGYTYKPKEQTNG